MSTATSRRVSFSPLSTTFKIPPILITEPPTMPVQDPFLPTSRVVEKPRATKDNHFYMADGDIVLLVENTLFRVSLSALVDASKTIRDYVQPPRPGQLAATTFTDRRPLVIREARALEFTHVLSLVFKLPGAPHPSTPDDYLGVLKLATALQMDEVREDAAEELCYLYMDPVRKIVAWTTYNLDEEDLLSSYVELCLRPRSLTFREANLLGIRKFTNVATCRELYRERVGCPTHRQSDKECQDIAKGIVATLVLGRNSTATGKLSV